jgi:hypothetical protein
MLTAYVQEYRDFEGKLMAELPVLQARKPPKGGGAYEPILDVDQDAVERQYEHQHTRSAGNIIQQTYTPLPLRTHTFSNSEDDEGKDEGDEKIEYERSSTLLLTSPRMQQQQELEDEEKGLSTLEERKENTEEVDAENARNTDPLPHAEARDSTQTNDEPDHEQGAHSTLLS